MQSLPAHARPLVETAARSAFASGLNRIFLIAAIIAFVAGVLALVLVRGKDFANTEHQG